MVGGRRSRGLREGQGVDGCRSSKIPRHTNGDSNQLLVVVDKVNVFAVRQVVKRVFGRDGVGPAQGDALLLVLGIPEDVWEGFEIRVSMSTARDEGPPEVRGRTESAQASQDHDLGSRGRDVDGEAYEDEKARFASDRKRSGALEEVGPAPFRYLGASWERKTCGPVRRRRCSQRRQ
jgi:hypothetical protein